MEKVSSRNNSIGGVGHEGGEEREREEKRSKITR
jgi:hypothetical protein